MRNTLDLGVEDGLILAENDTRMLAVGGVDNVMRSIKYTPEYQATMAKMVREARIKGGGEEGAIKAIMNRLVTVNE